MFGQKKTVKNENSVDPVFLFSKGLPRAVLALVFNLPAHLALLILHLLFTRIFLFFQSKI